MEHSYVKGDLVIINYSCYDVRATYIGEDGMGNALLCNHSIKEQNALLVPFRNIRPGLECNIRRVPSPACSKDSLLTGRCGGVKHESKEKTL